MEERIEELLEKIERLSLLAAKNVLTVSDLAVLIGVSESRIRHMVHDNDLPYYRQGKKIFFKKSEIEDWQLDTRVPSRQEVENKADTYITLKRLRLQ
jgi:excisionase family DNA binding protein